MGRRQTKYFYAVRNGKDGPMIYDNWVSCETAVSGVSGAKFKGFQTLRDAEAFLDVPKGGQTFASSSISTTSYSDQHVEMPGAFKTEVRIKAEENDRNWQTSSSYASSSEYEKTISYTSSRLLSVSPKSEEGFIPLKQLEGVNKVPAPPPVTIRLSKDQQAVLERVKTGQSVFFTGSAGTGKSVLLREIISELNSRMSVGVTASTGIASVNIGGTTLHSWAGIGLGKEPVKTLAGKIYGKVHVKKRWRQTDALVIDEISMIDGKLFDKLEEVARIIRGNNLPFGGIQLIVSGDFCQLPPVPDKLNGFDIPVKFAFEAETWDACVGKPIVLSTVFRQRDLTFVNMLNDMRFGRMEDRSVARFLSLTREVTYDDGIEPTELFPRRVDVERSNSRRLAELSDPSHTYVSVDTPGQDSNGNYISLKKTEEILERLVALKEVTLKAGAQVMLIKNMVQGKLVNGSLGQVIEFKTVGQALKEGYEIAKVDTTQPGDPQAKSEPQPETKPDVELVAASETIQNPSVWPVVQFTKGRPLLCVPVSFTSENAWGEVEASRLQIPLILAWALSVHKSQGQTLERVRVDLARTFEKGQAYVALSRATKMETLQVLNFNQGLVQAHPRVIAWYDKILNDKSETARREHEQQMDHEEAIRAFWEN